MKQKVNLLVKAITLVAVMLVTFASCGQLTGSDESKVTVNLPYVANANARALSTDANSRLKSEHSFYRVHMNDRVLEGESGKFTAYFAVGLKVDIYVESLNSKGQVIVRTVTKTIVVKKGENTVDLDMKADGNEITRPSGDDASSGIDPSAPVPGEVKYNGNGATRGTPSDTGKYEKDDTVTLKTDEPTRTGYAFAGWTATVTLKGKDASGGDVDIPANTPFVSTSTATSGINAKIATFEMPESGVVLTAQWTPLPTITIDANTTLADAFTAINSYPDGTICTISVPAGQPVEMSAGVTLNTNKTVTISGGGTLRRASSLTTGNLFTVSAGTVKFESITLDGANVASDGAVINVSGSGAEVELGTGATVQNGNSSSGGAGVNVTAGTFKLTGGAIKDCTSTSTASNAGGGVRIYGSSAKFEMADGSISGNNSASYGGGVNVYVNGTFTMKGGTITGNTSVNHGGGVFIAATCTFSISGTVQITNNQIGSNVSNLHLQQVPTSDGTGDMAVIKIDGAIDTSSNIGVTLYTSTNDDGYSKPFTSGWSSNHGSTPITVFSGDESGYNVKLVGDELMLQQ